jgi:hypothetical protein
MTVAVPTNVIEPAAAAVGLFVPAGNESVCFGASVAAGAGALDSSCALKAPRETMIRNTAAATGLNADMTYGFMSFQRCGQNGQRILGCVWRYRQACSPDIRVSGRAFRRRPTAGDAPTHQTNSDRHEWRFARDTIRRPLQPPNRSKLVKAQNIKATISQRCAEFGSVRDIRVLAHLPDQYVLAAVRMSTPEEATAVAATIGESAREDVVFVQLPLPVPPPQRRAKPAQSNTRSV